MNRYAVVALLGLMVAWGGCAPAESVSPPNIVLLFADDQRASTLLNPAIQTPHLDRLRAQGLHFTQAHIMGGDNGAVCAPSRAMLMTGRHLARLSPGGFDIPDDHALLGETLQAAGYDAYGIGKWHNSRHTFSRNFSGGDAIFMGGMHDPWNTPLFHYQADGDYRDRRPVIRDDRHSNTVDTLPGEYMHGGRHASEVFANAAIAFLESRKPGDKPFFLYTAFTAPHDPRSMPPAYLALYDSVPIELPPNFLPVHPFDNGELIIRDEQLAATPRDPEEVRRHLREYYAMISHLDAQVGRILDALERQGLMDNTLIVFAGDNGLAVGQHGLMGKQNVYQHAVQVPLIMAGPGLPQGEQRDALCYLIDLFPTLCDLTGARLPEGVDGRSLRPVIEGGGTIRATLVFQYKTYQAAIRDTAFKFIRYEVDGVKTRQLFDLRRDPWERENLMEAQTEQAAALETALDQWIVQHGLQSRSTQ